MSVLQRTKKQHYVPQVYLRGFSADSKMIWRYDADSLKEGKLVPIKSICYEEDLYELFDNEGKLLDPNYLEKTLSKLESMYGRYIRELEKKAFIKENYNTKCFLTKSEKTFWKLFIAIQMLRDPAVLDAAVTTSKKFFGDELLPNEARNFVFEQTFPFFSVQKEEENTVFKSIAEPLKKMSLTVCVCETGTLFTSDTPICCIATNLIDRNENAMIIVPLTVKLVLVLTGGELQKLHGKNRLLPLSDVDVKLFKSSVAHSAKRWLFTSRPFNKDDMTIISGARNAK